MLVERFAFVVVVGLTINICNHKARSSDIGSVDSSLQGSDKESRELQRSQLERIRFSDEDASFTPPFGGLLGTFNWEDTQNLAGGIMNPIRPQDSQGGAVLLGRRTSGTRCCRHRRQLMPDKPNVMDVKDAQTREN